MIDVGAVAAVFCFKIQAPAPCVVQLVTNDLFYAASKKDRIPLVAVFALVLNVVSVDIDPANLEIVPAIWPCGVHISIGRVSPLPYLTEINAGAVALRDPEIASVELHDVISGIRLVGLVEFVKQRTPHRYNAETKREQQEGFS
jgi:hypothetical protein